jgi:hypothetical protein
MMMMMMMRMCTVLVFDFLFACLPVTTAVLHDDDVYNAFIQLFFPTMMMMMMMMCTVCTINFLFVACLLSTCSCLHVAVAVLYDDNDDNMYSACIQHSACLLSTCGLPACLPVIIEHNVWCVHSTCCFT